MKNKIIIDFPVEIQIPTVPNYIFGYKGELKFDIKDLDEKLLTSIGEKWTNELILNARKRKSYSKRPK